MRWPTHSPTSSLAALFLLLLLQIPASAEDLPPAKLDCANLLVNGTRYDFSGLKGPHTITTSEFHPPTFSNTTYTLDLCQDLKRAGEVRKGDACPAGTRVCAIKHLIDPRQEKGDYIEAVIPLAGELGEHGGKGFEWTASLIGEEEKEGVKIYLGGGVYEGREQRVEVRLVCDEGKKGDEGEWESEDKYDKEGGKAKREEGEKEDSVGWSEKQLTKDGAALLWDGYTRLGTVDTLKLTWHTKLACAKRDDDKKPEDPKKPDEPKKDGSRSWGFFTWMVILVFMATASYLIFGSWLNYNRYGARGWDLLPHGDTLRDLPYLLKDWCRRVLGTVQGGGSRGGYSAV